MTEPLPKGARPDLSVDGTIELERLRDVLFVGRPAFGQEQSAVGLFRLQPDGIGVAGAGEARRDVSERRRDPIRTERRRPGDSLGHVELGRIRSHPASMRSAST